MTNDPLLAEIARALGVPAALLPSTAARLHHLELPHAPLWGSQLLVEAWWMQEALNEPYELQLLCLSPRCDVDLEALLLQRADLTTRLADGRVCRRSGLVRAAQALDGDGGLSRYRLTLVPWTWLLQMRRGSAVFQERPLTDIVDTVLAAARARGAWHWSPEVADFLRASHQGGLRSFCAYHREAEWDFVAHHLAREGLVWRYAESDDAPAGHALHLMADTRGCPEDPTSRREPIAWQRTSAEDGTDLVQALAQERQLVSGRTTLLTTDYRHKRSAVGQCAAVPEAHAFQGLEDYEPLSPYAFDAASAAHYAGVRQQAHETRAERWLGRSTVRSLRAGTRVRVAPSIRQAWVPQLLLTRVEHLAFNNLPREMHEALARRLGHSDALLPGSALAEAAKRSGQANRFEAVPADRPWRPAPPAPRPRLGHCSATVVGPDGQDRPTAGREIHTDGLGRVRVRFHWQYPDGAAEAAARADNATSCWVRIAQPLAGPDGGTLFVPRIGQEVLVGFLEGDIDRPIVRGALYNGRGEGGVPATPGGQGAESERGVFERSCDRAPSGQGNLTGGHAPAWHGAAGAEQANRAALSGIKTKEFGGQGFNQLVFDDTDAQLRVQAGTTQHASWLHLGHLVHQADNHRGSFRGLGFELRTDAWGAVRAGQGLLITSYGTAPREPAGDATAAQALMQQVRHLAQLHDRAATTHQTVALSSERGSPASGQSALSSSEPPLQALETALDGQVDAQDLSRARADAAQRTTQGAHKLPHSTDPVVAVAARAGLVLIAGRDVVVASSDTIHSASGRDTSRAAGGAQRLHTGQAIGVLAGGQQPGTEAQGCGITMVAAQGDVQVQAQSDTLQIAAKGRANVQSAHSHLDWAAAKKITLKTAGGASIAIEAGGITVQCPGKITVKAATKSMVGAGTESYPMPLMPRQVCVSCLLSGAATGAAFARRS